MEDSMYVVVYSPSTDEVYLERELADEEIMDARVFADQVADMFAKPRLTNPMDTSLIAPVIFVSSSGLTKTIRHTSGAEKAFTSNQSISPLSGPTFDQ